MQEQVAEVTLGQRAPSMGVLTSTEICVEEVLVVEKGKITTVAWWADKAVRIVPAPLAVPSSLSHSTLPSVSA
jgi:hypothetical protein